MLVVIPCSATRRIMLLVGRSQSSIVSPPLARMSPVRSKAIAAGAPLVLCNVWRQNPRSVSHNRILWSSDTDARILPSGDHRTWLIALVCPDRPREGVTPSGKLVSLEILGSKLMVLN